MIHVHLICGIVVSVITSSTVDRGLDPGWIKRKTIKLNQNWYVMLLR